jgi:hypothetical protein
LHAEKPAPQAGEAALLVKITNLPSDQLSVRPEMTAPEMRILRYRRQAEARRLLPDHRVSWCARKVAADPETHHRLELLPIKQSAASGHFYTGGHWSCNASLCPVCQARRAGVYLGRLLPALENNLPRFIYGMDTLTASTSSAMTAGEFIPKFKRAMSRFCSGYWWEDFRSRWHIEGWVTGQDFTQGLNGPHYHIHRLLIIERKAFWVSKPSRRALNSNAVLAARWAAFDAFVDRVSVSGEINQQTAALMHAEAAPRWVECCAAEGLTADLDHGYHIQAGNKKVAHYVGKLAMEVTQSGNKRGRGGRTLGQLLDDSISGDATAGLLWTQAVEAMTGMAILKASRGMWTMLEAAEPTDAEMAAGDQTEIDTLIALLPVDDWYLILRENLREDYFAALAQDNLEALTAFARLSGVSLLPPSAKNASAVILGGQDGKGGILSGRVIRVDLDDMIAFEDFDF